MVEKKERESNIELLRIITMFLIVLHHFAVHSNVIFDDSQIPYIYFLIRMGGKIGIDIFIIISGYFLIESEFRLSKAIKLYLQMFFYSLGISIAINLFIEPEYMMYNIAIHILPLIHDVWSFATTYLILYFLSPYINKGLFALKKEEFKKLLLILFTFFSFIPSIVKGTKFEIPSLVWFFVLYCIGAYIKTNGIKLEQWKTSKLTFTCLAAIIINWGISIIIKYRFIHNISFIQDPLFFYDENKVPALIIAILLFLIFKKITINNSKVINTIASATFGIYLIHEHPIMRQILWTKIFESKVDSSDPFFIILALRTSAIVFVSCLLIELIRLKLIEPLYLNPIKRLLSKQSEK